MTTQLHIESLVNTVGSMEAERKCVRNLLIITKLDNPADMVSGMDEGKIVEEEDLWCANVTDARPNTALVDNNIMPIKKTNSTLKLENGMPLRDKIQDDQRHAAFMGNVENSSGEKLIPNSPLMKPSMLLVTSFGPDEPLQFDLDNRSHSHASITISASQASLHDSQSSNHVPVSPVHIDAHESVIDSQVQPTTSSISIMGEISAGMNDTLDSQEYNQKASSHAHNKKESDVTSSSRNCMNTTLPTLPFPYHGHVPSNDEPRSTKARKTRRLVRPFVYSAIGSLECVNQNSLGSFNRKLCLASKSKVKNTRRVNSKTSLISKKAYRNSSEGSEPYDAIPLDGVVRARTEPSFIDSSLININPPSNVQKKKQRDICAQIRKNVEEKTEAKGYLLEEETTISSHERISNHRDQSTIKGKGKRVTIDAEAKKVRPVELFRPSCDAYTPRMGRNEIKYKPAKERASVEEISTTMGTIQRPNFKDALRRVAIIIQQHVVKIERRFAVGVPGLDNAGLFTPAMRDAFAEDNFVTPRYKCNMVNIPMARPGVIYGMRKIRTKYNIPTASDIYEFAHQIFNHVHLSSECSIICLIYVERLMEVAKVPVMANTWRPIFMCGLLLASKVWQDWSSWNIEFASVYPQFTLNSINRLEIQYLTMLKWNFYISPSLYAKYYFALRSLLEKQDFRHRYNRMVGADSRAALEAIKVSKRSEILKQEALLHLSMSV